MSSLMIDTLVAIGRTGSMTSEVIDGGRGQSGESRMS